MPDLTTIIGALVAALGGGATTAMVARRRPAAGSLDDHEERLVAMEERISALAGLPHAVAELGESQRRIWRALEAGTDTLDKVLERVRELDIESTVERRLRERTNPFPKEPTKP